MNEAYKVFIDYISKVSKEELQAIANEVNKEKERREKLGIKEPTIEEYFEIVNNIKLEV